MENLLQIFESFDYSEIVKLVQSKTIPESLTNANGMFQGIDAAIMYCLFDLYKPKLYLEVGSGNSTNVAVTARSNFGLDTKIIGFDPSPTRVVKNDVHFQTKLEDSYTDFLKYLALLQAGDILFFDAEHHRSEGNPVDIWYKILSSLPSGVLFHVHDVFLPNGNREWTTAENSEQNAMKEYLLTHDNYEILYPADYIYENRIKFNFSMPHLIYDGNGASFWLKIK